MLAGVGPVVVATSTGLDDDPVAALAGRWGAQVCRGPLDDVLGRFALVMEAWCGPYVIRATADNPAVDVEGPARVLQHLDAGADYVAETGLPVGGAVEGVRTDVLLEAARVATSAYDREHVTPFVKSHPEEYRVEFPAAPSALCRPDLRFTVDTPDELAYVRALFALASAPGANPDLATLIAAADRLGRGGQS